MKTILTLLIVALCLFTYAQHSFEFAYLGGINNLGINSSSEGPNINMCNNGGITYRYIGKKYVGGSIGLDVSGFKINPKPYTHWSYGYRDVHSQYTYLSIPIMMELKLGKKKVKGVFHSGVIATFSIIYKYEHIYYTYSPPFNGKPESNTSKFYQEKYSFLQPMQFGIPIGGGIQVELTKLLYMTVSVEDRFLFGEFKKQTVSVFNVFGLRLALGINASKPKEPKQ